VGQGRGLSSTCGRWSLTRTSVGFVDKHLLIQIGEIFVQFAVGKILRYVASIVRKKSRGWLGQHKMEMGYT
jgi:hypothetical protein